MNIIEELEKSRTAKNEDLEYLKESYLPLVLYGAALLAHYVKLFLERNKIKIDFVVVDKKHWQSDMKFHEFDVLPLEDVLAKKTKVNIVLAHIDIDYKRHNEKIAELKENLQMAKVLFWNVDIAFVKNNSAEMDFCLDIFIKNSKVLSELYTRLADDLSRSFLLEYLKGRVYADGTNLVKLNIPGEHQYFPDFMPLYDNEVFVDCGAYDGDTTKVFLNKTNGRYNKIFAFEPDSRNAEKCRTSLENSGWGGYLV